LVKLLAVLAREVQTDQLEEEPVLENWVGEEVVQGEFVVFGVVEQVVVAYVPASENPLVDVQVGSAFLGQLEVHVVFRGLLVLRVLRRNLVVFVVVGRATVACAKGTHRFAN